MSWFFCLLFGYYQLRPLREAKGFARGSDEIPLLFLASFLVMLIAVPLYGWVASRGGGMKLVRRIYRFFAANLVLFYLAMQVQDETVAIWVGRVYFVWLSVFNQFVVSMMWSVLADAYRSGQAKRLFGLISAGGTLGGIMGSIVARWVSANLDVSLVLLIGVVFLELCLWCGAKFARSLGRESTDGVLKKTSSDEEEAAQSDAPITDRPNRGDESARAGIWAGVAAIVRSPYLLGITGFLLAIKACATTVYCQQGDFVAEAALNEADRVQLFASINTWVLGITLVVQFFGTAALMRRLSMRWVLFIFPAIYVVGFGLLATMPTLEIIIGLVVVHRAAGYAVIAPAVETLYTVVDRQTLYRVKGIMDTAVIRGGDVIAAQAYGALRSVSTSLTNIAWIFVPVAILSCVLGASVGIAQHRRQSSQMPANRG